MQNPAVAAAEAEEEEGEGEGAEGAGDIAAGIDLLPLMI